MTCDLARTELIPYLSGELPAPAREQVGAHLAQCPACAEEAKAVNDLCARISRELHTWADAGQCPPEIEAQLRQVIRQEARHEARAVPVRPWRMLATAAAAVAVAVLVVAVTPVGGMVENVPILGSLAALFRPDRAAMPDHGVRIEVAQSAAAGGVTVTVQAITYAADRTVVELTVSGADVLTTDELEAMRLLAGGGALASAGGPTFAPDREGIRVTAAFAATPAGSAPDLQVPSLGGVSGRWSFRLPGRPR